ncbi:MAG: ABC-type transport auxiliary lipoprotein family protein [Sulfuriferula sp.]|nr:ABC-type transport auxiliary lipoprotein family protein [Sulfuriferula sp.]
MNGKLLIALLISLLSGCVNLGDDHQNATSTTYVLTDTTAAPATGPVIPHTLLVEDTHANTYDNNEALVFSHEPNTRGRYRYARWSELPSTRFSELLFNRLATANVYATVVGPSSDVIADRRLSTELLSFYHDTTTNPGVVHVAIRAELFDAQHHRLMARRVFEQTVPVTSYNAAGAAAAFNLATQTLLNDISTWIGATGTSTSAAHG